MAEATTDPAVETATAAAAGPTTAEPSGDPKSQAAQTDNEAAKFRRLFEKADKELAELKAAEQKRAEAEMTELEREKKRAADAEAKAATLERENLARRVAAEHNVPADAIEFLTGSDEATLIAQAQKLGGMIAPGGVRAGTTTNPGGQQTPTIDDRIAAAEKAGDRALAITLKRDKAGISRATSHIP